MFFERQLLEVEPAPGELKPEMVIKDPKDTWQRLNLTGASARQANLRIAERTKKTEELSANQQRIIVGLEELVDMQEKQIRRLQRLRISLADRLRKKLPSKHRVQGHRDVMESLGRVSALLHNYSHLRYQDDVIYKRFNNVRIALQKVAREYGCQFIAPVKGDKIDHRLHEILEKIEAGYRGKVAYVQEHGVAVTKTKRLISPAKVQEGMKKEKL